MLGWLVHQIRGGEPRALLATWRITVGAALVAAAGLLAVWNALRAETFSGYWSGQVLVSRAGVGGLLGLVAGLIAYAIIYHLVVETPQAAA